MEGAIVLMVICTILSPNLTTPSAGKLTDFFPRDGMCGLSTEERLKVQQHIQSGVNAANAGGIPVPECGPGPWIQIADFNIAGAAQCPPEWEFIGTPVGQAGCRQPVTAPGCTVATFSTGGVEYRKVCGRIIGAETGTPDAFRDFSSVTATLIDDIVLIDGVTITHSSPIQHIWTLAAQFSTDPNNVVCPCKTNTLPINTSAMDFAGDNFFCDTTFGDAKLLWNGDCSPITDAALAACCEFNNPPFFTAKLPTRTSANVDARLCRNQGRGNEDVRVQVMQLYVQ